MNNVLGRCIALFLVVLLSMGPESAYAAQLFMPAPGTMITTSASFTPVMIKGVQVHPEDPLLFDFIVDSGTTGMDVQGDAFKAESDRLIRYFLTALTISPENMWVNLSPYEQDRVIADDLGQTTLGRDMLTQDYVLKQLTSSLIYPEGAVGKSFWDKVYAEAQAKFGTMQIPVDTLNKVWITADKARVFERNDAGYVVQSHLKVMLEADYLAAKEQAGARAEGSVGIAPEENDSADLSRQIIRDVVIPILEKEVNEGEHFSALRQMFHAMILASWYKNVLKDSLLTQVYANKGKTAGVSNNDPQMKEKIYAQYLEAYKKGVFNYIKEEADPLTGTIIPRKYFSGGIVPGKSGNPDRETVLLAGDDSASVGRVAKVSAAFSGAKKIIATALSVGAMAVLTMPALGGDTSLAGEKLEPDVKIINVENVRAVAPADARVDNNLKITDFKFFPVTPTNTAEYVQMIVTFDATYGIGDFEVQRSPYLDGGGQWKVIYPKSPAHLDGYEIISDEISLLGMREVKIKMLPGADPYNQESSPSQYFYQVIDTNAPAPTDNSMATTLQALVALGAMAILTMPGKALGGTAFVGEEKLTTVQIVNVGTARENAPADARVDNNLKITDFKFFPVTPTNTAEYVQMIVTFDATYGIGDFEVQRSPYLDGGGQWKVIYPKSPAHLDGYEIISDEISLLGMREVKIKMLPGTYPYNQESSPSQYFYQVIDTNAPAASRNMVKENQSFSTTNATFTETEVTDKAGSVPTVDNLELRHGGIDLNANKMDLGIDRQGRGVEIKFDPLMIEQFKRGDFAGIVPFILKITPIVGPSFILGLTAQEMALTV